MNRRELAATLSRAGLREYQIQGVHEPDWLPEAFPYLRGEAGRWIVGICERGTYTPIRDFREEDTACRFFQSLMRHATPPPPPAGIFDEEAPGLLKRMERWGRVAWSEYRRARRRSGGGGSGRGGSGPPGPHPGDQR
ncbi:hypothetical protein [Actinoallomurus rhizosphaericola]|uniref:hypothetical protein n=1 Tax=Actinoallomurus rhizosphaericola TaxID=2952536 RepID=UPI002092BA00|nr:hypothetical protein [Actinoallomurus rhizosphaericola]MCO5996384.1 hypothetical protein [Actinoallomurus rhizosphaericola]